MSFDIGILLAVLFAMLLSSMPKKLAMFICLVVTAIGLATNAAIGAGYLAETFIYRIAGITESMAAFLLILIGWRVINPKEAKFFFIMAGFLMASSALNSVYIPIFLYTDYLNYEFYTFGFHIVAILHVLTMFAYSDGIGKTLRNIRGSILGHDSDYLGIRD